MTSPATGQPPSSTAKFAAEHGAKIRPGCFAVGFDQDAAGHTTALIYVNNNDGWRQRCRTAVLAAGTIEAPRLLLLIGLANGSGQVGRNFMTHVETQA